MPKKIKNTEEKMKDFLFDITAGAEVTHDHVEDWFKEKGSVNNTLLYLANRGHLLENWLGDGKKDKEFIVNEMIKFFRDAYFRAEETFTVFIYYCRFFYFFFLYTLDKHLFSFLREL